MRPRRPHASSLAEVLIADHELAYELFVRASVVIERFEDMGQMPVPTDEAVRAAESDLGQLRARLDKVFPRFRAILNLRTLIESHRFEAARANAISSAALLSWMEEFANKLTGRLILELPTRGRVDGGPIFDAVELAPLTPPDEDGHVEPIEDLEELAPEHRATARWALFGHTPGEGVDTIGEFDSAFDALNIVRRLFGDVRIKPWATDPMFEEA